MHFRHQVAATKYKWTNKRGSYGLLYWIRKLVHIPPRVHRTGAVSQWLGLQVVLTERCRKDLSQRLAFVYLHQLCNVISTNSGAHNQGPILGFHMTSRPPCWCPQTMQWRPCWCPDPILRELKAIIMLTSSFVFVEKHGCWSREWNPRILGPILGPCRSSYF